MKNARSIIVRSIDGDPVNIDPLSEIPAPEMRLYCAAENYFKTVGELIVYCIKNKTLIKKIDIIEYYRNYAGCSAVIKKSSGKKSIIYTAVGRDGYGLYNRDRSIYRGEHIWEYSNGNIRKLYEPFKENGIILENDIYGKLDEEYQYILKHCREHNSLNAGKQD